MDPYRDDRDALRAMLDAAEARARRAEERAVVAEGRARVAEERLRRHRQAGRAAPGEVLVVRTPTGLDFLEPGASAQGLGRVVLGALPDDAVTVRLQARRLRGRDGELDLDAATVVRIAADRAARMAATRQFVDAGPEDVASAAAPLLEAALRQVIAARGVDDVGADLDVVALALRVAAEPALRDLGLELGHVLVGPADGVVARAP